MDSYLSVCIRDSRYANIIVTDEQCASKYLLVSEMAMLDFNKARTSTSKSTPLWKDTGINTAERKGVYINN